jgi:prepilin-type processing-associated H-X9-DG protein/prepilin-type N-terminal cleavage/methylation domain-containing protein
MRSIRRPLIAFTLIEMMVVLTIISFLVTLFLPSIQTSIARARSLKCAGNLRVIGLAASLAATDNHNRYPEIDQAGKSIYTPPGPNLITALESYGVTTNVLECPIDVATPPSNFATYGSSYEWDPVFDEEPLNETVIYITPTLIVPVNSSRVRLAMDFTGVHRGRPNVVFGDGHVAAH